MMVLKCILNMKLRIDVDRSKTNDTTTATDVRDGSVTASFTEGRGFIPMPHGCVCSKYISI